MSDNNLESMEEYIEYFCAEMQELGYAAGEVNAFVHDVVEDSKLSELNQEESMEIMDYMKSYLLFAKKCKKVTQN